MDFVLQEQAVLHFQLNQYGRNAVLPRWEQGGQKDWICLFPSLLSQCLLCLHSLVCWEYPSCCKKKKGVGIWSGQEQEEKAVTAF